MHDRSVEQEEELSRLFRGLGRRCKDDVQPHGSIPPCAKIEEQGTEMKPQTALNHWIGSNGIVFIFLSLYNQTGSELSKTNPRRVLARYKAIDVIHLAENLVNADAFFFYPSSDQGVKNDARDAR